VAAVSYLEGPLGDAEGRSAEEAPDPRQCRALQKSENHDWVVEGGDIVLGERDDKYENVKYTTNLMTINSLNFSGKFYSD
jgi:hypothetical protein